MGRRRIFVALIGLLVLTLTAIVSAVGTVVTTSDIWNSVTTYTVQWTSDASGDVSGNAVTVPKGTRLIQVRIIPGATTPTALYDVSLKDASGVDLLNGEGADQSNSVGEYLMFNPVILIGGRTLDVVVSNAGNAKTGTVEVWVQ